MKRKVMFIALTAGVLPSVLAGTMGPVMTEGYRWFTTLSLGAAWENAGDTQTLFLDPEILKTYAANDSRSGLFTGELFIGVQNRLSPLLQGQIGLAFGAAGNARLNGSISDDADPVFNNYSYSYKVQHSRVAVKGKLAYEDNFWVAPYVSASAGVASNRAHDFSNTPRIFEAVPNANFSSNSETSFTYTLGAGLQKSLNTNWQVGIGYEFADWGKSELGRAPGQTTGSGLQLNHLYTHGVLFNLTYLS